MTVLKLDISFLAGFVAPALFGFVETPLFDFSSRFALLLLRFFSVLITWPFFFWHSIWYSFKAEGKFNRFDERLDFVQNVTQCKSILSIQRNIIWLLVSIISEHCQITQVAALVLCLTFF